MIKKTLVGLVAGVCAVMAAPALAQECCGLTLQADVHGASSYSFRGQDLSDNKPSVGAGLKLNTIHGVYASANVNTVTLQDGRESGTSQYLVDGGAGYALPLGHGITVGGGLHTYQFMGPGAVEKESFSELRLTGGWQGAHVLLAKTLEGGRSKTPGMSRGDIYGEVGYTHQFGRYSVGADLGYTWYKESRLHPDLTNGVTVANLRAGYQVSPAFSLGATLQVDGKDGYREHWEGNNRLTVTAKYVF